MEAESTPTLADGSVVAGRYEIVRRIGEGGLGEVYECIVLATGGKAALKILKPALNKTTAVERFLQEPRAAAAVNHKRIIKVSDAGESDGVYFLVMELLTGHDLGKEIERFNGKLPIGHAINVLLQVCDALAAAHGAGVIHRDLKPENIFVTRTTGNLGTEFEVKLLDFGIARIDGAKNMTQTTTVIGTPVYMSPEQQLNPKGVDGRTDIYALGVMAYEAITGRLPFEGETLQAVFAAQLADKVAPMGVDSGLEAIVLKAMAKSADNRYQSIPEFAEALKAYTRSSSDGLATPRPSTLPPEPTAAGNHSPTPLAIEVIEAPARAPTHIGPFVSESRDNPSNRRRLPLRGMAAVGAAILLVGGLVLALGGHKPPTRVATAAPTTQVAPPLTPVTSVNETAPTPVVAGPEPTVPTSVPEPTAPRRLADSGRHHGGRRHRDNHETPATVTQQASCRRVHVSDEPDGTPVYEWRPRGCTP